MAGLGSLFVAAAWLVSTSGLVASDVIRAGDQLTPANTRAQGPGDGASLLGREVVRTVYAGETISRANTRSARLVKRNDMVTVRYVRGVLDITTTARSMGEAGEGESVTLLNLQSRKLVRGTVQPEGWVLAE